jgi:Ca-activated chloride channel family protein
VSPERFAHPEWLAPLGLAWLAVALALAAARWHAGVRAARLLGPRGPRTGWHGDATLLLALGLVGVGLLGPRGGWRSALVPSRGVDLVLLVDVSRSMDARDVAPSRLARAQRAGAAILAGLGAEDRAALAIFAGRGVLLTPLTPDRDALRELLASLTSDLLRPGGSHLADGVLRALEAFEPASERPRAILVLSDGEDPAGRSALGSVEALRAGTRVHVAAVGLEAGAPIPDHEVPLRDEMGAIVTTRRHAERLLRLATTTGGQLFAGDMWGEIDVDAALAAIRSEVGAGPGGLARRRVRALRVAPFAALAFALLAGEAALRTRHLPRRPALALGLPAALLLAASAPPEAPVGIGAVERLEAELVLRPRDPALLLELGIARLERGRPEEAARAFTAAALSARDAQQSALAYYDLGVARLEGGAFEAARDAFFDALAIDPTDREARFNLEWTLRELARRPPPPPRAAEPPAEPAERHVPKPTRGEAPASAARSGEASPRDAGQLRRWLERVDDDLGRALRSAVRDPQARRSAPGPGW